MIWYSRCVTALPPIGSLDPQFGAAVALRAYLMHENHQILPGNQPVDNWLREPKPAMVKDVTFDRFSNGVAAKESVYKPIVVEAKKDINLAKIAMLAAGLRNVDGLWQSTDKTSTHHHIAGHKAGKPATLIGAIEERANCNRYFFRHHL
jgi:hypothetical protein